LYFKENSKSPKYGAHQNGVLLYFYSITWKIQSISLFSCKIWA